MSHTDRDRHTVLLIQTCEYLDERFHQAAAVSRSQTAVVLMETVRRLASLESGDDVPTYTLPQIKAAWRLMCRGEKEGLRKRDIGKQP
jgi:hypothetical protein